MTQSEIGYPYAMGNLLEKPNTYFYTDYLGQSFIDAWQKNRQDAVVETLDTVPPSKQQFTSVQKRSPVCLEDRIDSMALLREINDDCQDYYLFWCKRLAKKFEISKRLYDFYQKEPPYRPHAEAKYTNLNLYLFFAEHLIRHYQQDEKIQWLNVLLKMMDTLTSQCNAMDKQQRVQLNWLIKQEKACFDSLLRSVMS